MEFTLTFLTHLRFNFTSMQQVRIKSYESRLQTMIGLNIVFLTGFLIHFLYGLGSNVPVYWDHHGSATRRSCAQN